MPLCVSSLETVREGLSPIPGTFALEENSVVPVLTLPEKTRRRWHEQPAKRLNQSKTQRGILGGSAVVPPSAQGVIPEIPLLRRAPCMEPTSPSAFVSASLCVSLMNK